MQPKTPQQQFEEDSKDVYDYSLFQVIHKEMHYHPECGTFILTAFISGKGNMVVCIHEESDKDKELYKMEENANVLLARLWLKERFRNTDNDSKLG
jgi:hypothetical protein